MKKNSIIVRVFIIIFSLALLCLSIAYAQSPEDIRTKTQSMEWYSNDLPSIVGQKISGEVAYDRLGAYCIDEHQGTKYSGYWTVDSVIDINNSAVDGEGKVIVHTASGDYTYSISEAGTNKGVFQALRLGFLARLATERGETGINIYAGGTSGSAKFGMAVMFGTKQIANELKTIHIGEGINSKGIYNGMAGGTGAGIEQTNKDLEAATKAASNQAVNVTNTETEETEGTEEIVVRGTKDTPFTKKEINGKTLIYVGEETDPDRVKIFKNTEYFEIYIGNYNMYSGSYNKVIKCYKFSYTDKNINELKDFSEYQTGKPIYLYYDGTYTGQITGADPIVKERKTTDVIEKEQTVKNAISGAIKDATINLDKIGVEFKDGKTYLGPYRITYTECTPSRIEIITNNGKAFNTTKISYNKNAEIELKNIEVNKDFYIVVDQEIKDEISKITVVATGVKYNKARIILLKGWNQQNFIEYRGDEETEGKTSCELPLPKSVSLEILKEDEFNDEQLNLKGIGFKVFCEEKGWLQEENGKIIFKDTFDEAKTYYTDESGKVVISNQLPVGKYSIYEAEIPESLALVYSLNKIEVPKKDGTTEEKEAIELSKSEYIASGQRATLKAKNYRAFSELQIEKYDADTQKMLENIGFKIYSNEQKGWVKAEQNNIVTEYTQNFEDATEFKTGVSGEDLGKTPVIKRLKLGTYKIFETSLGNYEKYYTLNEYEYNGKIIKGIYIKDVTLKANKLGEPVIVKVENKQTNIKISGFVWEEVLNGKNTVNKNYIYKEEEDRKIQGIKVRLKDTQTGKIEKEAVTDEEGRYEFNEVNSAALSNYVVEFEFDGLLYESIVLKYEDVIKYDTESKEPKINEVTCKAVEDIKAREELNSKFEEITGEGQILEDGTELQYDKNIITDNNNKYNDVKLKNIADRQLIDETHVKVGEIKDFPLVAQTEQSLLEEYYSKLKNGELPVELNNINFAVFVRETPNITAQKDVFQAEVNINGATKVYPYNKKLLSNNAKYSSLGVKMDGYNLPIYRSDISDAREGRSSFDVIVWYKIKLYNASTNLYTKVNSIREAFTDGENEYSLVTDKDGPIVYIGDNIVKDYDKSLLGDVKSENKNGLDRIGVTVKDDVWTFDEPIELSSAIQRSNTKYLYVLLRINNIANYYTQVMDPEKYVDTSSGLRNSVEINSYSVYSDKEYSKLYAGVDNTSIPSNYDFSQAPQEDDEDRAPGLLLTDAGNRTLEGKVFEDNAVSSDTNERIGNGKLDDEEKGIENVAVQLIKIDETGEHLYRETVTNADGEYTLEGFTPGNYRVEFIWGDNNYNVQDYKGTVYNDKERITDIHWCAEDPTKEEVRNSDAIDDYDLRLAIDKENLNKNEKTYTAEELSKINSKTDLDKMHSSTPEFEIAIEKEIKTTQTEEQESTVEQVDGFIYFVKGGKTYLQFTLGEEDIQNWNMDTECPVRIFIGWPRQIPTFDQTGEEWLAIYEASNQVKEYDAYKVTYDNINSTSDITELDLTHIQANKKLYFIVDEEFRRGDEITFVYRKPKDITKEMIEEGPKVNYTKIDFGIIERPQQILEINKTLSQVEVVTTQGQPIANAILQEDGKLHVIAGDNYISGSTELGYIWVQIDKSITQATTLKAKYNFIVKNNSEIDYDTEDYYKFGDDKDESKIIRLGAQEIYDYIKGAQLSSEESKENWQTVGVNDYTEAETEKTITEIKFDDKKETTASDGTKVITWNIVNDKEKEVFADWEEQILRKSQEVRDVKLSNRDIIKYNGNELVKLLEPGENQTVELNVSILLNNKDETRIENDSEFTSPKYDEERKTGRALIKNKSQSYDRAEWITVTPATGENKDYTPVIITLVIGIIVLGIGIVVIKKKVL